MNWSYWEKSTFLSNIDVAVIGSGIVGLSAALYLKKLKPKWKIVVLERGMLPSGASTKNAGFACFGSISELIDDMKNQSEETVFELVKKRWEGLQLLRKTLGGDQIGYEQKGGFEIFGDKDDSLFVECREKVEYFNRAVKILTGIDNCYQHCDDKISCFGFAKVKHLIKNTGEGQLDTGKMMRNLLRLIQCEGVIVLNRVTVEEIVETGGHATLKCSEFQLKSKKVLVANNGFATQLLPELDVKPARAQVLITEAIPGLKVKGCFHYDRGFYYFRDVNNRILLGGGRNLDIEGETTTEFGTTGSIQLKLENILKEVILPQTDFTIEQRWSGIMGVGKEKTTLLQEISPHVFCAVRLGGMGVALGGLVGKEAAEMVADA